MERSYEKMIISILNPTDNIQDYIECTKKLNNAGVPLASIEQICDALMVRPSNVLTFVGKLGDRIVATATVIMEKKLRYNSLCCHIEDVGVHPEFRNRGYGKDIVEYCVKVARSNGCYKIKLNCNDELLGFYTKIGFVNKGNHMIMG